MWSQLISYLIYFKQAQTKFKVHSPFVYDLITNCLEKPLDKKQLQQFRDFKKELLKSETIIQVEDFGAGSTVFNSNERKVKDIASIAGMSESKAKLVLKLTSYFKPLQILEIGTSIGIGTHVIKTGIPQAKIITLEGCPNTAKFALDKWEENYQERLEIIVGEFSKTLPQVTNMKKFDMIYFDGNHQIKPTLAYFEQCMKSIHNNTFFIFDDIHLSNQMEQAWQEICQHPQVRVSIDLFTVGLIFFKKELTKQNFILKI